jgi:hypothetical protein
MRREGKGRPFVRWRVVGWPIGWPPPRPSDKAGLQLQLQLQLQSGHEHRGPWEDRVRREREEVEEGGREGEGQAASRAWHPCSPHSSASQLTRRRGRVWAHSRRHKRGHNGKSPHPPTGGGHRGAHTQGGRRVGWGKAGNPRPPPRPARSKADHRRSRHHPMKTSGTVPTPSRTYPVHRSQGGRRGTQRGRRRHRYVAFHLSLLVCL